MESESGNLYILTVSDYFSKWVKAVPLLSKHAVGVAHALFKVSKNEVYSVAVVRVCWKHYSNKYIISMRTFGEHGTCRINSGGV